MTGAAPSPMSLAEPALHESGGPFTVWTWMREHAPVCRHAQGNLPAFWSLTRYEDIRNVYRDARRFSSARGVMLRPTAKGVDPGSGLSLALTDPPRHKKLRSLIVDPFSDRGVRTLAPWMTSVAGRMVAEAIERGSCDLAHVAARFTMKAISQLIGIAESDHESIFAWTSDAFLSSVSLAANQSIMAYLIDLMDARRSQPRDDLTSRLVHGRVDGQPLAPEEVLLNLENLLGATENAGLSIAGGLLALIEHPDQWGRLHENPAAVGSAVEEILRWTSSATHSMRTVTEATTIRDTRLDVGDRVVLWLPSANRDNREFRNPNSFDVMRRPNRHIALGFGEHFCIGATLARSQLRILLSTLLRARARFEPLDEVRHVRSIVVNGPTRLRVLVTAAES